MGRISEIRYERRQNLGSYEHEQVGLTVVVDEEDNAGEVMAKTRKLVQWQLKRDGYEAEARKLAKQLQDDEAMEFSQLESLPGNPAVKRLSEEDRESLKRRLAAFETMKKEMEALDL